MASSKRREKLANTKTTKPTKTKKQKTGFNHLFGVNLLVKFTDFIKTVLTPKLLEFSSEWMLKIGHWALIASAALGIVFSLIVAFRLNSFYAFLYGLAWILIVFVVQYTAHKFSKAGEMLIKNNPSSMSSKAFLDCLGFLTMIGGVIFFILGIIRVAQGGHISFLFMGLGGFVLLEFFTIIAFNPKLITKVISKTTSAGQEAIGIIVFFIKGFMKLVPVIFGVGVVVGFVLLFIDFLGVFGSGFRVAASWERASTTSLKIIAAGLLPFLSYLLFVLYYLAIDVIRAILAVPGKLDELKK
jgi:hypothetical protein